MGNVRPLVVAAVVAVAGLLVVGSSTAASAAATVPAAIWEMNEGPGATVMTDTSGNGLHGRPGTEMNTGVAFGGAMTYHFPRLKPNTPPAHPEHNVTVPDNDLLDPGTADFAVTIRFRTLQNFGNILQKGQSGAKGGYFKFQMPKGKLQCLFRGPLGSNGVGTGGLLLNDGVFHTVRCERAGDRVTLTVDGVVVARKTAPTGNINNTWPLSIGGKTNCDQIKVTCDYFPGYVDRVQIDRG